MTEELLANADLVFQDSDSDKDSEQEASKFLD